MKKVEYMLVVGIWIAAALALVLAILVFRRAQVVTDSGGGQQGVGKWLLPFVMAGFMSLRLAASLHRGIAVAFPITIAVVSVVVLITFGVGIRSE